MEGENKKEIVISEEKTHNEESSKVTTEVVTEQLSKLTLDKNPAPVPVVEETNYSGLAAARELHDKLIVLPEVDNSTSTSPKEKSKWLSNKDTIPGDSDSDEDEDEEVSSDYSEENDESDVLEESDETEESAVDSDDDFLNLEYSDEDEEEQSDSDSNSDPEEEEDEEYAEDSNEGEETGKLPEYIERMQDDLLDKVELFEDVIVNQEKLYAFAKSFDKFLDAGGDLSDVIQRRDELLLTQASTIEDALDIQEKVLGKFDDELDECPPEVESC